MPPSARFTPDAAHPSQAGRSRCRHGRACRGPCAHAFVRDRQRGAHRRNFGDDAFRARRRRRGPRRRLPAVRRRYRRARAGSACPSIPMPTAMASRPRRTATTTTRRFIPARPRSATARTTTATARSTRASTSMATAPRPAPSPVSPPIATTRIRPLHPVPPRPATARTTTATASIDNGFDKDNDGFYACSHGTLSADCDDTSASIHPGAVEICNGKDDDCNGMIDELPANLTGSLTAPVNTHWALAGTALIFERLGAAHPGHRPIRPARCGGTRPYTFDTFDMSATFWIQNKPTGADGMTFAWVPGNAVNVVGTAASACGIGGLGGYAVLIDTFVNTNEPAVPFLAVVQAAATPVTLSRVAIPNVRDSANHRLRVRLDAGKLSVWLDGINYSLRVSHRRLCPVQRALGLHRRHRRRERGALGDATCRCPSRTVRAASLIGSPRLRGPRKTPSTSCRTRPSSRTSRSTRSPRSALGSDPAHERVTAIDMVSFSQVSASTDRACLVVIYGPELGKRAPLGQATFEIGRSSRSDLPIDQESISRHHARITFDGTAPHRRGPRLDERHLRERRQREAPAPQGRRPGEARSLDPEVHGGRQHRGELPRRDLSPDDDGCAHADAQPSLLQRGARARVQPQPALPPRAVAHPLRHRSLQEDQRHLRPRRR